MRRTTGVDSSVSFIWQTNEISLAAAFSVQYQRLEPIKHVGPGVYKLMSNTVVNIVHQSCLYDLLTATSLSYDSYHFNFHQTTVIICSDELNINHESKMTCAAYQSPQRASVCRGFMHFPLFCHLIFLCGI